MVPGQWVELFSHCYGNVSEHEEHFEGKCQDIQKFINFDLVILFIELP